MAQCLFTERNVQQFKLKTKNYSKKGFLANQTIGEPDQNETSKNSRLLKKKRKIFWNAIIEYDKNSVFDCVCRNLIQTLKKITKENKIKIDRKHCFFVQKL